MRTAPGRESTPCTVPTTVPFAAFSATVPPDKVSSVITPLGAATMKSTVCVTVLLSVTTPVESVA